MQDLNNQTNGNGNCTCINCEAENKSKWSCRRCGRINDYNDLFCAFCGERHESDNYICNENLMKQNNQKNRNLIIAFAIVFALLVVVSAILCFFTPKLINNILIALASSALPIAIGIGFNLLGNAFRDSKGMQRFLHIFGSVFHCFCPIILLIAVYYSFDTFSNNYNLPFNLSREATVIITLTLSFLGYIPAHYNKSYSLLKNNILSIIGLFSSAFMWSFISSRLAVMDSLNYTQQTAKASFDFSGIGILFLKVCCIFILLQALKLIAEEFDD